MTAADWLGAIALAALLCLSASLDGPDDIQAARDIDAAVQELGQ